MITKVKKSIGAITWVWGNKKLGVGVYLIKHKHPYYRIGVWKNNSLFKKYDDYETKTEAIKDAKGYARSYKKVGLW